MRTRFQIGGGSWWRYSAYEIRSGLLQPRKDAVLEEVDLWKLRSQEARGRKEAPYQTLINLVRQGAQFNGKHWRFKPSRQWREQLLDWCSSNGLLGILPQITHSVTLAPHWSAFADVERGVRNSKAVVLVPEAFRFDRSSLGWIRQSYGGLFQHPNVQRPYSKQMEGRAIPRHLWPARWPRPSVFIQPIDDYGDLGELTEEPIGRTWGKFFPSVPENKRDVYPYPMPHDDEFWKIYTEPVELFWKMGMRLARIDEILRKYREKLADKQFRIDLAIALGDYIDIMTSDDDEDENEGDDVRRIFAKNDQYSHYLLLCWAVSSLNRLVQTVQPALMVNETRLEQKWFASSLLSAFAMMMVQDLAGGVIVRECPMDRRVFSVQAERWTKYCSNKCAERGRKREQRARKRPKLAE
jgi:hypothetical protein